MDWKPVPRACLPCHVGASFGWMANVLLLCYARYLGSLPLSAIDPMHLFFQPLNSNDIVPTPTFALGIPVTYQIHPQPRIPPDSIGTLSVCTLTIADLNFLLLQSQQSSGEYGRSLWVVIFRECLLRQHRLGPFPRP